MNFRSQKNKKKKLYLNVSEKDSPFGPFQAV